MFFDPLAAALIGWLVSMTSRQAGHFFFEPRGYDHINQTTHEHKEDNQGRLQFTAQGRADDDLGGLAAGPLFRPTLFGMFTPWASPVDFMRQVAKIWLVVGIGGLLFRTVQLFFIRDIETGLVWMTKILTDPFNDFKLYRKAPLYLMKGELIDPGLDIIEHGLEEQHPESLSATYHGMPPPLNLVMPGLVPGIHVFTSSPQERRGWPGHLREVARKPVIGPRVARTVGALARP